MVLDDAAWEGGGRIWGGGGGLDGARELPVGVAGEVLADEEGAAPGEAQHFPAEPEVAEGHGEEGWEWVEAGKTVVMDESDGGVVPEYRRDQGLSKLVRCSELGFFFHASHRRNGNTVVSRKGMRRGVYHPRT